MSGRILYRIVRNHQPTVDDFRSQQQLGRPLRDQAWRREWLEGVSTYDSLEYAIAQARALRFRAGRFVAPMLVPIDGSVETKQTGLDPRHVTIYATGAAALDLVCGPIVVVEDQP